MIVWQICEQNSKKKNEMGLNFKIFFLMFDNLSKLQKII